MKRLFSCCRLKNPTKRIEWKDTVPFVPPVEKGTVIKVYDGDTITVAAHLPYPKSPLFRFRVRLARIDAPEIRGHTREEKERAIKSRDRLAGKVLHKQVRLSERKTEKYGRILAEVYLGKENMSDWLLRNDCAVPYSGGRKKASPQVDRTMQPQSVLVTGPKLI